MDCRLVKTFCTLAALKKKHILHGTQRQLRKGLSVAFRQRFDKRFTPMTHSAKNGYCDLLQRLSVRQKLLQRIYSVCDSATTQPTPEGKPPYIHRARHFTLALMGEFQNGKSTLFNYLCDGRELSPMGKGISTSCCRVAAHALRDAQETEHAYVQWRSEGELRSLIENALSGDKVTYLNHAEPLLAEKLLKAPNAPATTDFRAQRDMLRFALLAAHFYPKYAHLCRREKSRRSLQQAVQLASYPTDWEELWVKVRAAGGRLKGIFTKETAAFVFCRGIDLYLHSPMLSALGCSVVDSPGFFSSEWDTRIANECAREASSILYILNGKNSLSEPELAQLKNLPKDKIIFATNLHTDRKNWKRIMEKSINPRLSEPGLDFVNPVVHEFHAAMALRARELHLLQMHRLPEMSRAAIEHDIKQRNRTCDADTLSEYLEKRLKRYAETLAGDDDVNEAEPSDLELESGVPNMLSAVIQEVLRRHKERSLACVKAYNAVRLVDSLLHRLIKDCKDALEELRDEQAPPAILLYQAIEEPSRTSRLFGSATRKYVYRKPTWEKADKFGRSMLDECKKRICGILTPEVRHRLQTKYEAAKTELHHLVRQWPSIAAFATQPANFPTDWNERLRNICFRSDLIRIPECPQNLLMHYYRQCKREMIERTDSPVRLLEDLHRATTEAKTNMERICPKVCNARNASGLCDEKSINSLHKEMETALRQGSDELKSFLHHYTVNPSY